jgi:hypothetical protein
VNVVLFALKEMCELPCKAQLVERLEKFVSKERVDAMVLADLKESLDDLKVWNGHAVDASNSSTKNSVSGKKKPKRNKKRGKRK